MVARDRKKTLIVDVLPFSVGSVVNECWTNDKNIFKVFFVFRLKKFQEVIRLTATRHSYDDHVERRFQVHFFYFKKNVEKSNRRNFKPRFCVFDFGFSGLPPDRASADSANFKKLVRANFFTLRSKKVFFPHSSVSSLSFDALGFLAVLGALGFLTFGAFGCTSSSSGSFGTSG